MDLEKVSEERLSTSVFRIRSEAYLTSGQRIDLGTLVLNPAELEPSDDDEYNNEITSNSRNYEEKEIKDVILRHQLVPQQQTFYFANDT